MRQDSAGPKQRVESNSQKGFHFIKKNRLDIDNHKEERDYFNKVRKARRSEASQKREEISRSNLQMRLLKQNAA